ncbi:hypothetical protein QFZ61_000091 [Arthrobacter sp. B3I4]|nr:hypothetical protein [Arthrobacter sp. B3I4]
MTSEAEQPAATGAAGPKAGSKPRYGVPVWRVGKPDAFLAASVDVARAAVEGIAPAGQVGRHLAVKSEGDRLVTHLFESKLPGYGGWQWYAVLTRNSRSKVVTVDELGLLPSEDSILAPEWVPWAERVRPEDAQQDEAAEQPAAERTPADADAQSAEDAGPETGPEEDAAEETGAELTGAGEPVTEEPGTEATGAEQTGAEESSAEEGDGGATDADFGTGQDSPAPSRPTSGLARFGGRQREAGT